LAETLETNSNLNAKRLSIGLILAGVLVMGFFAFTSSGSPVTIAGCNNPASLEQCGTGSCLPVGTPVPVCSITVTFSPAFLATPKFASAQITGCHFPECHFETENFPMAGLTFQSDNGETWTNMPAATTEIYGNSNHEVSTSTVDADIAAVFSVNCITGSASATATLRPQFSIDSGASWTELSQNPGGLDILVDSSDCSFATSPAFSTNVAGINAVAVGKSAIIFRVVGFNGNGVGDVPVFNNLQLTFFSQFANPIWTCIQGVGTTFQCPAASPISKTTMTINIFRMSPAISQAATSQQVNWMASE
jgi:hypothetical protein